VRASGASGARVSFFFCMGSGCMEAGVYLMDVVYAERR